jgi:dephospho-CoA kinase
MKVVVVTGGIGSGKTSACRFLADEYGWPVYSADDKVK